MRIVADDTGLRSPGEPPPAMAAAAALRAARPIVARRELSMENALIR